MSCCSSSWNLAHCYWRNNRRVREREREYTRCIDGRSNWERMHEVRIDGIRIRPPCWHKRTSWEGSLSWFWLWVHTSISQMLRNISPYLKFNFVRGWWGGRSNKSPSKYTSRIDNYTRIDNCTTKIENCTIKINKESCWNSKYPFKYSFLYFIIKGEYDSPDEKKTTTKQS